MKNSILSFFVGFFIFIFFLILITNHTLLLKDFSFSYEDSSSISSFPLIPNRNFTWPTPGFMRITSPFGKRKAPAKGSSTNHSGIDIAAPEGTHIYAVCDGTVAFLGFKGAGGYTITIRNQNFEISYCHVSPHYLVFSGQKIKQGQLISQVGPYYVSQTDNNPYKDKTGRPTNGALTGCHLHLSIKKDGNAVNPLDYF